MRRRIRLLFCRRVRPVPGRSGQSKKEVNDLKRKLFALLLSGLAIILLMGAGVDPAVLAAETADSAQTEELSAPVEEPADQIETAPEASLEEEVPADPVPAPELDRVLLLDGQPVLKAVCRTTIGGETYVSLKVMSQQLDPSVSVSWDANSKTVTVTSETLKLTATAGKLYLEANGRYLYMPEGVQLVDGQMMVSLDVLAKAFDAVTGWDGEAGTFTVTSGSGAIASGDAFYNSDDLFWLSRVIFAESGNQCLEGKMAVGNVIMNRINHKNWPDTILGVIAQKNQFTTYRGGKLANRTPNAQSVIAAKLVLDGGVVEEVAKAYFFDSTSNSWASRNKTCLAVIGGHKFYG